MNLVNQRPEFFFAAPAEARKVLLESVGNLLEFTEEPEATQFLQSRKHWPAGIAAPADSVTTALPADARRRSDTELLPRRQGPSRGLSVQIRRVVVNRFRGIEATVWHPGSRAVLIGPNNAAKSTLLDAINLVLHPGLGRPRPVPDELDYFGRDPSQGFEIEVIQGLRETCAEAHARLDVTMAF